MFLGMSVSPDRWSLPAPVNPSYVVDTAVTLRRCMRLKSHYDRQIRPLSISRWCCQANGFRLWYRLEMEYMIGPSRHTEFLKCSRHRTERIANLSADRINIFSLVAQFASYLYAYHIWQLNCHRSDSSHHSKILANYPITSRPKTPSSWEEFSHKMFEYIIVRKPKQIGLNRL